MSLLRVRLEIHVIRYWFARRTRTEIVLEKYETNIVFYMHFCSTPKA